MHVWSSCGFRQRSLRPKEIPTAWQESVRVARVLEISKTNPWDGAPKQRNNVFFHLIGVSTVPNAVQCRMTVRVEMRSTRQYWREKNCLNPNTGIARARRQASRCSKNSTEKAQINRAQSRRGIWNQEARHSRWQGNVSQLVMREIDHLQAVVGDSGSRPCGARWGSSNGQTI